jgi:putative peptidoglycan lipid II flippase
MLIARYYGSTGGTDSLFFSLNIAEAIRTLIISGAVASIFIPIMTDTQRSGKIEETRRLAWVMLGFVTVLASVVVLLAEFGAPWIVRATEIVSMSGKTLEPARFQETIDIMRIMLPVILMVSLWGLMGGILNAFDNFYVPGFAPLIWNMTIIAVPILYGDREQVSDIAWAFVVGHFLQMLVHVPWLRKTGIRPGPIDWGHPMLRKFLVLAPAAVFAYAAPAVNSFIGQGIALNIGESTASHLAYAFRTQQLPMAVFGVSVATAMFPTLSRCASAGMGKELMKTLASGIRMTTLATLPAVVFFMVLPNETIRLLFERGRFTPTDTIAVAQALFSYSWAILPMGLILLTARTFFSEKDTRTPALLGFISIVVNYVLAVGMSKLIGFTGIALATAAVSWVVLIISIWIIQKRHASDANLLKEIGLRYILSILAAGFVEAVALWALRIVVGPVHGTLNLIGMIGGAAVLGALVYIVVLKLLKNEDLELVVRRIARRK